MKDRGIYIAAALECIELNQSYTEDYDLQQFLSDRKTQDAVVLLASHPNRPWREIAGMRNVLAHEYLGVDPTLVWDTIETHYDRVITGA